jgi:ubiquitin conjugation factor E4 B
MNDERDPFNRAPLSIEQVIPCPELKEKIENYRKEKLDNYE